MAKEISGCPIGRLQDASLRLFADYPIKEFALLMDNQERLAWIIQRGLIESQGSLE